MTQEEKELLIIDLCSRLPYGVKFLRESWNFEWDQEMSVVEVLEDIDKDGYINNTKVYNVEDIKPYLRHMSSMTKEELKEYKHFLAFSGSPDGSANFVDWLNKKMFAYRTIDGVDMFKLNLALQAPKGMYNLKEK